MYYTTHRMIGSFEVRDGSGDLVAPDSVEVKVYVDGSTTPEPALSSQASSYLQRDVGLYTYAFDAGPYPPGTAFTVDAKATKGADATVTTERFIKPGLLPSDLAQLSRVSGGYYSSPCGPCYGGAQSPY